MSEHQYSYLDLCVLPDLRDRVLSSVPVVVFDSNLEGVLWANAAGVEFFGGNGLEDLLSFRPSPTQPFIQQLRNASSQIKVGEPLQRGFRVVRGIHSELIQCEISHYRLPNGETALLLASSDVKTRDDTKEHEIAALAVNALAGLAHAAAVMDDYGLTIAATETFSKIDLAPDQLNALITTLGNFMKLMLLLVVHLG